MIVPDLNLLLYAHDSACPHHAAARRWWEATLNGSRDVGLPWAVSLGFVRLTTHPRVMRAPLEGADVAAIVSGWHARPCVRPIEPGPRHLVILSELLGAAGVAGSRTTDAHLAALVIEHRATLFTNDRDFGRFPGLQWVNPLALVPPPSPG